MIRERMKDLRIRKGMTQTQFGNRTGQSHNQISKYEIGLLELNLSVIKSIAHEFDVSADYLLGLTDIETPMCNSEVKQDYVEFVAYSGTHMRIQIPKALNSRFCNQLKAGLPELFEEVNLDG